MIIKLTVLAQSGNWERALEVLRIHQALSMRATLLARSRGEKVRAAVSVSRILRRSGVYTTVPVIVDCIRARMGDGRRKTRNGAPNSSTAHFDVIDSFDWFARVYSIG